MWNKLSANGFLVRSHLRSCLDGSLVKSCEVIHCTVAWDVGLIYPFRLIIVIIMFYSLIILN